MSEPKYLRHKQVLDKVYKLGDEDTKALIDEVWVSYNKESDEIYGMGDEPPRVIDIESESKIAHLNAHDNPMEIGQHIIRAIADYDEALYELVMCKHASYPDEEDDKYYSFSNWLDGTANFDNDVDWAELHALIGAIQYMSNKYYNESDDE